MSEPDDGLNSAIRRIVEPMVNETVERVLGQLADSKPPSPNPSIPAGLPTLLDVFQLAEFLRLGQRGSDSKRNAGVRTIRGWVIEGRVPHIKLGGRVLFNLADIMTWLEGHRRGGGGVGAD